MTPVWILLYLAVFAGAFAASLAAVPLAKAAALRFGVLDRPAGRKDHAKATPVNGGWAVHAVFFAGAAAGMLFGPALASRLPASLEPLPRYLENIRGVRREMAAVLAGAFMVFVMGAIDDVRPLGPRLKLAVQIAAALPLVWAGVVIRGFLPWPPLGWGLTVLWAVALMNAFNFMDNTDGVCATVAATVAAVLALAAALGGELWLPALFLLLAGSLAGFLVFNFHPASIFLGDAGALTAGYLLAAFSVMTTYYLPERPTTLPVLIPLAAMGVPLFDLASVLWIRLRAGKPLMTGDHNHFAHRLRAMGFSIRATCGVMGALTAATGLLSLALRRLPAAEALLHALGLGLLFAVVAALEFTGRKSSRG